MDQPYLFPLPKRVTKTKWFISNYDFRMVCGPLLQQGGSNQKSLFHDNIQKQQQHEPRTLLDLSATAAGKNGRVNKGGILTAKTKLQATC